MAAHRRDDDESRADAERTAQILLDNADLPLLIRARACMILGCSDSDPDFLKWAKEGVRVAKLGAMRADVVGNVEYVKTSASTDARVSYCIGCTDC